MKPVKLIIVDDHPVVVQGFSFMLQDIESIQLTARFHEAESALAFVKEHVVDIVLLDINLPGMHGIEACARFREVSPDTLILAISNNNEYSIIKRMLDSGASGYLLKNCSAEEVVSAIHQALDGELGLSESVQEVIDGHQTGDIPVVTRREQEVLALLAQGLSSVEIGTQIFISPATVESHRRNLLKKFNVANVAALVHRATEMKYI